MSTSTSILQTSIELNEIKPNNYAHIKSKAIDNFLKKLSISKIKELSNRFKPFEIHGKISHKKFIYIINEVFDNSYIYLPLYELIFSRFKRIKCSILNNKDKSFITNLIPEDEIITYEICCALSIFITCNFKEKLHLLFDLTDIDEDGFLNEEEIVKLITTLNFLFCNEEQPIPSNSHIINQSLANIRIKENLDMLMYIPGELKKVLKRDIYVDFETFYEKLTKIPFYKYKIIPCFVNFRDCLNVNKKEVGIVVNKEIKNDFVNISNELLPSIKLSPNKNENLKFKYPKKLKIKDILYSNDYTSVSKPRNFKQNYLIPKISLKKNVKKYHNSSSLNTKASTVTENVSLNASFSMANESIEKSTQRKSFINLKNKFSLKDVIFKNISKREITCNYDKIHNMEIHPALIKINNNEDSLSYKKLSPIGLNKVKQLRKSNIYKELMKKQCRYLTSNDIISEIDILSNKHKGEEFHEKVLSDVNYDIKEKASIMKNKLKENNKSDKKMNFLKYKNIRILSKVN